MNFDPVGTNSKGLPYMKFHKPFSPLEKIQLLQRSILVNSFAYYELNDNILEDYVYDNDAKQLEELSKDYPDEFKRSKYYAYFHDFYDSDEHYTSGFDLLERVRKNDNQLYRYLRIDATLALDTKSKRGIEQ